MTIPQNILTFIHEVAIFFPVFLVIFSFHRFFLARVARLLGIESSNENAHEASNPFAKINIIILSAIVACLYAVNIIFGMLIVSRYVIALLLIHHLSPYWFSPESTRISRIYNILYSLASPTAFALTAFFCLACIKLLNLHQLPHYAFMSIVDFLRKTSNTAVLWGAIQCMPLPPFAAARIWYSLIPRSYQHFIDAAYKYNFIILMMILFVPMVESSYWIIVTRLQFLFEDAFISLLF